MNIVHPTLPDWRKTVPDADAERWLAAGWLPEQTDAAELHADGDDLIRETPEPEIPSLGDDEE